MEWLRFGMYLAAVPVCSDNDTQLPELRRVGSLGARLIGMVATVALVTTPMCMGNDLLAYRLATALGLTAVYAAFSSLGV